MKDCASVPIVILAIPDEILDLSTHVGIYHPSPRRQTDCRSDQNLWRCRNVQNESILYVHTHDGTENIICDAAKRSEESYYPEGVVADDEKRNGTIYCNGSVVFSGSGSLQITGKKKHGISVKSSVTFRPGVTVVINDVDNNCVKADGITILGAIYGQRRLQKQENASVLMLTSPYRAARSNFTHQAMLSTKRMRTTHLLPPA